MTKGAYYEQKRTSPTALAIVLLMHGAGIAALALAKGEAIRDAISPTDVIFVEEDKPPPPLPVEPVEKVAAPKTAVTHVPPVVQLPSKPVFIETPPLPPVERIVIQEPPLIVAPPRVEPPVPEAKKVQPARARANLASYVSDEDYPNTAARNAEQGTTRFRLGVGPDGRVSECTVTASSGSSALDSATCRLMKQRARFTPARNSAGDPTSDNVTSAIRWVLPD